MDQHSPCTYSWLLCYGKQLRVCPSLTCGVATLLLLLLLPNVEQAVSYVSRRRMDDDDFDADAVDEEGVHTGSPA